jgi:hypothetical protein
VFFPVPTQEPGWTSTKVGTFTSSF